MSGCTMPMLAAKIAVVPPMIPTTASAVGAYSKRGDSRATMNTPAVTMVAAWIKAETGVGPSIASGSQVWSGICADFPIAPMNKRIQARVSESTCQPRNSIDLPTTFGAAPNDEECLDRSSIGGRAVVPEADQQVGHQADTFPAEEQLHEVVGCHQCEHEEGEQAHKRHEARDRRILSHVADRIDVDHRRDDGHDTDHDAAQRVEPQGPADIDAAGHDPARQRDNPHFLCGENV